MKNSEFKTHWPLFQSAWFLCFLFLSVTLFAETSPKISEPKESVQILWNIKIPMRDGIKLNGTVYKPKEMKKPLPVIFTLTPYLADSYHDRAYYFSQNGYIFVLVDSRGRGGSEGKHQAFINEGRDGYDVVEWLARQSWSNGKVAMWGGSYGGFNQWSTLKEFPPHLATIVPAGSPYPGFIMSIAYRNIMSAQMIRGAAGMIIVKSENISKESSFWIEQYRELYLKHLPFKELMTLAGDFSEQLRPLLEHPTMDAYWEAISPSPEQYRKMNVPILTITGHYDFDQGGALRYYSEHLQYASKKARDQHYLIIGPWDHPGTRTPAKEFSGLKFGEASLLDLNKLHQDWYDWTLKAGKKPEFLKKRVAYYTEGTEEWRYADRLEEIVSGKRTFYLNSSDGIANDVFHSGMLTEQKIGKSKPDHYIYDPLDVRPADLEREEEKNFLTEQSDAYHLFGSGLIYHSDAFQEETFIGGKLKFVVSIAMDVPDTDFQVSIYEITKEGSSILLTEDKIRARFRESMKQEKLVQPGEIIRYEFDQFNFFARRISKGSRLRLLFRSPNSIFFEKNYNSGGNVAEESGKDARTAHITLYHDEQHPSFLEVPVVK